MVRLHIAKEYVFLFQEETSISDAPPAYLELNDNKNPPVEVCDPPPNSEFEPVGRQQHFGMLRYTVNIRSNILMFVGIINVVLIVGVILTIVLVNQHTDNKPIDTTSTVSKVTSSIFKTTSSAPTVKSSTSADKSSTFTTKPSDPSSCKPFDKSTLLLAYSNDFDPVVIFRLLAHDLGADYSSYYTSFAGIRFDTKIEGEFQYQSTFQGIGTYMQNHLPDPSLGFDSSDTGSDVFRMIERFLDNNQVPVCGSIMIIYVKRYPNKTDYSRIVEKMRQYHSYVNIFATNIPAGGSEPEALYDFATKTNGLCGFEADLDMQDATSNMGVPYGTAFFYAVNPEVTGHGFIELPSFSGDEHDVYYFTMSMKENGFLTVVQKVMLSYTCKNYVGQLGKNTTYCNGECSGNLMAQWERDFHPQNCDMRLDYDYSDSKVRRLQIRIHGPSSIDYWPPYDN